MNLDNLSREVRFVAHAATTSSNMTTSLVICQMRRMKPSLKTTKGALIEENSESISAAVDEISEEVVAAVQKELDTVFKKAFR